MASETQWNWKLVAGVTALGAAAVLIGVALQDWEGGAWGGVLVEVGAGLALVAAIVFLERRVLQQVSERAESVARDTAARTTREETADLRDRVTALEDLERAESEGRHSFETAAREAMSQLEADVSLPPLVDLLETAYDRNYFDPVEFCVRGADSPDCHLLHFDVLHLPPYESARDVRVRLAFKPFFTPAPLGIEDFHDQRLDEDEFVAWEDDTPLPQVAAGLEALLSRSNLAPDGFSLPYAIRRLLASVEVMSKARSAVTGSPLRLHGRLRLLLNDEWALTTQGLESLTSDHMLVAQRGEGVSAIMGHNLLIVPRNFAEQADPPLQEALDWVQNRDRLTCVVS